MCVIFWQNYFVCGALLLAIKARIRWTATRPAAEEAPAVYKGSTLPNGSINFLEQVNSSKL